ncbi:4'-phosphopantetheinyl transferase family protein [Allostreptomyces psammosilenae]|uniref:4'-phosphopantetheinyl transferase n=1 Tax=Allostreptomyces psammosilenae TaxID=1892865 RepID=A0A853ACJ5_9ACTN|nr:4'-phosphopantetheinyl transferase superfamily protein [Allostreptomyces psammosilenae]NYI08271.1 4'-phosphopantetheinyl transferase [Allostreptomyces psammosilenae]
MRATDTTFWNSDWYPETVVECHVWWAAPLTDPHAYLPALDTTERARHDAYQREEDRARFGTARLLAKLLLGREAGLPPAEVELDATCRECGRPHGRPVPVGLPATRPPALSLSHSGDRVVVAVARTVQGALSAEVTVGVDVERLPPEHALGLPPTLDGVLAASLDEEERRIVGELPEADRCAGFLTYWTRKEAVLKATGEGLTAPMRRLRVSRPGDRPRLLRREDVPDGPRRIRMAELRPGPGYTAALAVLLPEDAADGWRVDLRIVERSAERVLAYAAQRPMATLVG